MNKGFYSIFIVVAALSAFISIILSIWYGVNFRGTEGYTGNLYDFCLYTLGIFLSFIYAIVLRKKFLKRGKR